VDLYGLTYGTNSPLNICEKIYLQDLAEADVSRLVGLFRTIGVTVPQEAPGRIYALTGGHPYLTMRLCALLEGARAKRLGPEQIEAAAEELLVEDDNLHHLVRELERLPQARRRLADIVLGGQQIPFSRVDPVLGSLEMIGAIKPAQPCQVRNRLYERALRPYLEGLSQRGAEEAPGEAAATGDGAGALGALREAALGPAGAYRPGREWQAFAEALFRRVPAFSVYANVTTDSGPLGVLLAVDPAADGGAYWSAYEPAVLVEPVDIEAATPRRLAAEMLGRLEAHGLRLAILVAGGPGADRSARAERLSGVRGDRCLVTLDDADIARLIAEGGDLDALLRRRVLEARLRRL